MIRENENNSRKTHHKYSAGNHISTYHFAQIRGKITGSDQQPIEGATIILEQSDSTYIDATVTASDGTFEFFQTEDKYILIVQHLLYETEILNGRGQDCGSIQLRKKAYNIDEIVV